MSSKLEIGFQRRGSEEDVGLRLDAACGQTTQHPCPIFENGGRRRTRRNDVGGYEYRDGYSRAPDNGRGTAGISR